MKKVLLFVGSFNPPTLGHKKMASIFAYLEYFDEIWVQPSYKNSKKLLPGNDRINMLKLLIKSLPDKVKVSDVEITHKLSGTTFHILQDIRRLFPKIEFSIVLGSDNIIDIHRWKESEKLIKSVSFVIVPRPGYPLEKSGQWYNDDRHTILVRELPGVSSTELRESLHNCEKSLKYTSSEVLDYIYENNITF